MLLLRQTLVLAASISCLFAVSGCDSDTVDAGGPKDEGLRLADLTENIEEPADDSIEPTGQICAQWGAAAACLDEQSAAFCGVYEAVGDFDYVIEFGSCVALDGIECFPGDTRTVSSECGMVEVSCDVAGGGVPAWGSPQCDGGETPLVLRFDDAPIMMIDAEATPSATFDISMTADQSGCITTDWPSAATPWLAIDLDQNGSIDGGHELFGSGTQVGDHKAQNGFIALAAYDDNRDGRVDAHDARFNELLLWRDYDADRMSSSDELERLSDAGVDSLAVAYASDRQCDARGNCGIERAQFSHAGGHGEIVDIHLACQ
jgi:hypothetical protein